MPRARRKASPPVAAPEPVEEEAQEPEDVFDVPETAELKFDQPLVGRPGKPIAVAELLKRLKALHAELASIDQDDCPRESVTKIAAELVNSNVLGNKDRGVKAWAPCCIVEVFRLTAPDAPFKASQLKEIFEVVVSTVIPSFKNPSDPYSEQHARVLYSLDEIKSIALLPTLPGADSMITRLFANVFDLLGGSSKDGEETLAKNVEYHLSGLLATLVDECETVPSDVTELILAQFLRTDPSMTGIHAKNRQANGDDGEPRMREFPPAYQMAKNICNTAVERMSRSISHYFSSVIIDASDPTSVKKSTSKAGKKRRRDEDSESEEDISRSGPSAEEMKELAKAHRLLRELWRSAPDATQTVISQLDAELGADNVEIRVLAVETTGDMVSGIGAAGLPTAQPLDPAAYPSQSTEAGRVPPREYDILTKPSSPQDFSSVHSTPYQNFLKRRNDRASQVRAACAAAIAKILITSAGGIGLDNDERDDLLQYMSEMLLDTDEKVRLAAVKAIGQCSFDEITHTFGQSGGISAPESVLGRLADRIKDKKQSVRAEIMKLLANIWGVASGAIIEGSERMTELFGAIPSRIFDAVYVNDLELTRQVQNVLFDSLVPLTYPPIKDKAPEKKGSSQRVKDSQTSQQSATPKLDADAIRAERILYLAKDLDPRAKRVLFVFQKQQVKLAGLVEGFLKACEAYNGGVSTSKSSSADQDAKNRLTTFIDLFSKTTPDVMTASDHLWKFAKKHDRRAYHLIRFMTSPENDYKKITLSIRELKKRYTDAAGNPLPMMQTLMPIIFQSSVLIYNRSHVPAILERTTSNIDELGEIAHEILGEISTNHPEVFKAHVRTMCKTLTDSEPASDDVLEDGILQTLRACAGFAQRFPSEMPHDRELLQALVQFALHGNPPKAAKHAVSILVANEDKRDMYMKDLVNKCVKDFDLQSSQSPAKLAALSQLLLLAAPDLEEEEDTISTIAIRDVMMAGPHPSETDDDPKDVWHVEADHDTEARIWALKILVNRLRGFAANSSLDESTAKEMAKPVFALLQKIINKEGQVTDSGSWPEHRKSRLRLAAGLNVLKSAVASKHLDHLLTPTNFNKLALLAQDPVSEVRAGFVASLKKYLGANQLPQRFHAIVFLLAFEPTEATRDAALTWLRGRSVAASSSADHAVELSLARFISLLAHHPDFSTEAEHCKEWVDYILFYLRAVARADNLPLIFHVAQRVKSVRDGIDDATSENLYFLSDTAQAVIREYADVMGWQLPAYEGKVPMPSGIFAPMPSRAVAQEVAEKNYAIEEVTDVLDEYVRARVKGKKRKKVEGGEKRKKEKVNGVGKVGKAKGTKTPRQSREREEGTSPAVHSAQRRRSGRQSNAKSYVGMDDSEDDDEAMEDAGETKVVEEDEEEGEADEADEEEVAEEVAEHEDEEEAVDDAPVNGNEDDDKENEQEPEEEEAPARPAKKAKTAKAKKPVKPVAKGTRTSGRATRSKKSVAEVSDEDIDMDDE